jgi:hypothetical protein
VPLRRAAQSADRSALGSPAVHHGEPVRARATRQDLLLLQRTAGNRAVAQILQRQKAAGRYQLTKEARLRGDAPPTYPVLHTIAKGSYVQVQDKGARTSNFKAGRKTNEHSWTTWQATSGWIEDSKLKAAPQAQPQPQPQPQQPAATVASRPTAPMSSAPKPIAAPPKRTQPAAIGAGGNTRRPTEVLSTPSGSFVDELNSPRDLNPLLGNVRATEVKPVDQDKLKVTISGGRLYTHDREYPLDSGGAEIRYVLCQVGNGGLQLYASQLFDYPVKADTDDDDDESDVGATAGPVDLIRNYPTMQSHAQVTGTVIGAGDFVVTDGRITQVSNQSGTWHPHGNHLAAALRAMTAWNVLDAGLVKTGKIRVKQFLPDTESDNPDAGETVTLKPSHLQNL